jgi:hypothetical protein
MNQCKETAEGIAIPLSSWPKAQRPSAWVRGPLHFSSECRHALRFRTVKSDVMDGNWMPDVVTVS